MTYDLYGAHGWLSRRAVRSDMRLCSFLLPCLAAALSSAFVISPPHMWTKLILTHHWPSTFCSDLLPDMKTSWPDLLNPLSASFWKYEWHKHGTCAAKAPSLNSQHKYFSKALELYHKVDLDSILKKFDITPSEKYYKLSQIEGVIENFYSVKPKIQCVHPSKNADFQILGQIEICFNPDFTLLDCEKQFTMETTSKGDWDNPVAVNKASGFSVCDHDMPVYYPPLP
ncbi:hypothetical protein FQN60_010825 [Etheostoma spectabile]|uniref:Uncharacterized protein n=1 Tax=Etheostoma spectabile TaxID=54343 RepID=A0A5J5DQ13_9PERO|nr:hypothetical protein FQN60_010825 [Etheostoma spectabile]